MMNFFYNILAILYRRFYIAKISILAILGYTLLSVLVCTIFMLNFDSPEVIPFEHQHNVFYRTQNPNNAYVYEVCPSSYSDILKEATDLITVELKKSWKEAQKDLPLNVKRVDTWEKANEIIREEYLSPGAKENILLVYGILDNAELVKDGDKIKGQYPINVWSNSSLGYGDIVGKTFMQLVARSTQKKDIILHVNAHYTAVDRYTYASSIHHFIAMFAPYCIPIALFVFSLYFAMIINDDIKSPKRPYMINCGLSVTAYWVANFIVDYVLTLILLSIIYIIYAAKQIKFITEFPALATYILFIAPISCILFTYFIAIISKTKVMTALIVLLLTIVPLFIPLVLGLIAKKMAVKTQKQIACIFPSAMLSDSITYLTLGINQDLNEVAKNLTVKTMFDDANYSVVAEYQLILIAVFAVLIFLYEFILTRIEKKLSEKGWENYKSEFIKVKASQNLTEEALNMEAEIAQSTADKYAIRIKDASKCFKDAVGNPICAVNQVSLGIERGSVFGFLGANGAGKTTLMKMILRELPISNGKIEINGNDITKGFDSTQIAICPQFDDHLTPEFTPYQQLNFYGMIFNIPNEERQVIINDLIEKILLEDFRNKIIRELSGGNRRKVCVATTFLTDAKIILLDEPTSSVDPITRKAIHDIINDNRKDKTIMLCTHLLDEAEMLCDNISIMLKGCIYVVGSPQYLSAKFGKDWKVDLILEDSSKEVQHACSHFIKTKCPRAKLTIKTPVSRIYSIPADALKLTEMFRLFQEAKDSHSAGIKHYTCSMATLEKVFLEIVMLSENHEGDKKPEKQIKTAPVDEKSDLPALP